MLCASIYGVAKSRTRFVSEAEAIQSVSVCQERVWALGQENTACLSTGKAGRPSDGWRGRLLSPCRLFTSTEATPPKLEASGLPLSAAPAWPSDYLLGIDQSDTQQKAR